MRRKIIVGILGGFIATLNLADVTPAQAASVPQLDHVFVIVMENTAYSSIIGSSAAPYINSLLASGGVANSYYAITHPSLPNYLSLTGASTFGITSDCTTCWVNAPNIADRLESAGKSWKAYEESMPSACFVGDSYPYAQKHDPFIYFNDIRNNASRCQSHVVPYGQLASDLQSAATTPNYAFITPNMCSDMHDCSIQTGDSWLRQQVPTILSSPAFRQQRSLLALTWDEDDSAGANKVPLILLGSGVGSGLQSSAGYNHYSLLHTIEVALGASAISTNDGNAALIADLFATSPPPPPPVPHPWTGLYTLEAYGGIHPVDGSLVMADTPSFASPLARTVRAAPGSTGAQSGLVLDAFGGLHSYGSPGVQVGQEPYYPNLDIARDFVFLPSGTGGYELDGYGGIHPFSIGSNTMPVAASQYPYFAGSDLAKKITLLPDASGGYILDAYGGLHPWSAGGHSLPVAMSQYGYWPGMNIARDLWLAPGSNASSVRGYVLDGFGGFHAFWSSLAAAPPAMAMYGYWGGQDIARSIWFLPGATAGTASGFTLDAAGGLHPFTAPAQPLPANPGQYAYWPGRDIAKSLWGA